MRFKILYLIKNLSNELLVALSSSATDTVPEQILDSDLQLVRTPRELVREMMRASHTSTSADHKMFDPIYSLTPYVAGCETIYDRVYTITYLHPVDDDKLIRIGDSGLWSIVVATKAEASAAMAETA